MKNKQSLPRRLFAIAGSNKFFYGIVVLLILQALWIALSGRYPMAFDEDFHLGIISLYAHHINPFWNGSPDGVNQLGAVTRDPSYLYHYLMSFPYRLVCALTANLAAQIIFLRLINIGLFAWGIFLYKRLLAKTAASRTIVNLVLLVFVLVPIVPLLAAQINYDNLALPLTAITLLLAMRLRASFAKKLLDINALLLLLTVCLLASLVKYAFLPIFAGVILYLIICIFRSFKFAEFNRAIISGCSVVGKKFVTLLLILFVLSFGLFAERYAVNLVRYHKPVADCAEVLDYQHCQYYGPWIRDYNFSLNKGPANSNPLAYTQHWFYGMWLRTFFAVDGPHTDFQTRSPLILPGIGAVALAVLGLAAFLAKARSIWRTYNSSALWLMSIVAAVYSLALWLEEYKLYRHTGQPVAINGRYLLPILPFLILFGALAINLLLKNREKLKLLTAVAALICFIWGGGALTYVLRSNNQWYWNNSAVRSANHAVQNTIGPLTPGYYSPTEFVH